MKNAAGYCIDKVIPREISTVEAWTWWHMEEVFGGLLHQALEIVSHLECEVSKLKPSGDELLSQEVILTVEQRSAVAQKLEFVQEVMARFGLLTSAQAVNELHIWVRLFQGAVSRESVLGMLQEVQRTIGHEMNDVLLIIIRPEYKQLYLDPENGWERAAKRWPRITIDLHEMSKCFVCQRYPGAIFHALLIAEFGVIQVCDLLQCSGDRPGWGCLERLQRILKKAPKDRTELESRHCKFLEDTLPLMHVVKDSWRHKISHVDNRLVWLDSDFSAQTAEEIILATRGLMRRLALDLPPSP